MHPLQRRSGSSCNSSTQKFSTFLPSYSMLPKFKNHIIKQTKCPDLTWTLRIQYNLLRIALELSVPMQTVL